MTAIFISYRRDDTQGEAGRLFEGLRQHFGEDEVFMDVTDIAAGNLFGQEIERAISQCDVFLALIGKEWLHCKMATGERRLNDPQDFVRLEVAAALRRNIPVIPVLVQDARMPDRKDLQQDLRPLAERNAAELRHARWDGDLRALVDQLEKLVPRNNHSLGTRMAAWSSRITNHPIIAFLMVVSVAMGGVLAFGSNLKELTALYRELTAKPSILVFGLSPAAVGYKESQDVIFGASEEKVRTFEPVYPFVKEPHPVFLIALDNPTDEDLIVTALIYDVEEASDVKGGSPGPLQPLARYQQKITHAEGRQTHAVMPPFRVPAKSAESLELELGSATDGYGLGWLLRIVVQSNLGQMNSERFQLYLPKVPQTAAEEALPQARSLAADSHAASASIPDGNDEDVEASTYKSNLLLPDQRDNLLRGTGVLKYVEDLDHLDRDLLLVRAQGRSFEEYKNLSTETTPPRKYGDVVPEYDLYKLWKVASMGLMRR